MRKPIPTLRLTLAVAAALSMNACEKAPVTAQNAGQRVCTDRAGVRVPEDRCQGQASGTGSSNAFLWYYLGTLAASNNGSRYAAAPAYGQRVSGGSYTAPVAARTTTTAGTRASSNATTRGGFGASASAHPSTAG